MTTLPAVVRIVDLPVATTITGAELWEVVQTTAGVGLSVQVAVSAIMTTGLGALPTSGNTGQILNKTSATSFASAWSNITQFVAVGTSLATTGSATSIVAFVANQGITSTQIANNAVGTSQLASSLGIASSLSVGTLLTVGGTATVTGTTILNGGLQVAGTSILTGIFGVVGTAQFTGSFNVVGTTLVTGLVGIVGTTVATGAFGVVGTTLVTGAFGVVGQALVTGGIVGLGTIRALAATAAVAGGTTTGGYLITSIATFGMFCGTGVPTMTAGTGSIYLRTDGTTATTRLYIATSAAGGWTGVTTVG